MAVLLPDIHYPEQDNEAMRLVGLFLKDHKVDEIIYTGDGMNMSAVCHWEEKKNRKMEGKRVKAEYLGFVKNVLNKHREIVGEKCKFVYLIGNHENWIEETIDKDAKVEGYYEVENNFPSWVKIIPFNKIYKIGKLRVTHGFYTNKYHASKTVDAFERNVVYGHTHDIQFFTKVLSDDVKDFHSAQSIGCLCNMNPDYMENRPNNWVHGFGVAYFQPNGYFNFYQIVIVNNEFIWNRKIYK